MSDWPFTANVSVSYTDIHVYASLEWMGEVPPTDSALYRQGWAELIDLLDTARADIRANGFDRVHLTIDTEVRVIDLCYCETRRMGILELAGPHVGYSKDRAEHIVWSRHLGCTQPPELVAAYLAKSRD